MIDILTLIAVVWYASTASHQLEQMGIASKAATDAATAAQVANSDARDRFRQDQRPYVWTTSSGVGTPEFVSEPQHLGSTAGQVSWTWHYTNYGKTPAYNVRWHHYMSIDGGPFIESYHSPEGGGSGGPLPPTQDVFATVVSKPGITREEFDRATGIGGKGVSIHITLEYTDASDGKYETQICLQRLNTGSISYCKDSYLK